MRRGHIALVVVVLTTLASMTSGRAETVKCTPVTLLPAVIATQGVYCLTGNLQTSIATGSAIEIQTNNVVLDLNGFKLGGLGAGPSTTAYGIHAVDRQNITIKNGTVRGFLHGIVLENVGGGSAGHVVEDIRADQNTFVGINIQGSGNIVRNNQIVSTGGSTALAPGSPAFGIFINGEGPRVLNNDIIGVTASPSGSGTGIFLGAIQGAMVVNNRISKTNVGVEFNTGTGKYRDNLTVGVTAPYLGGTDAGNNH